MASKLKPAGKGNLYRAEREGAGLGDQPMQRLRTAWGGVLVIQKEGQCGLGVTGGQRHRQGPHCIGFYKQG